MEEWFKKLGENIAYLHLNDNLGDKDAELVHGKGTVDWKELSKLVSQYVDNPYVALELKNLGMIKETATYMSQNKVYPFA